MLQGLRGTHPSPPLCVADQPEIPEQASLRGQASVQDRLTGSVNTTHEGTDSLHAGQPSF